MSKCPILKYFSVEKRIERKARKQANSERLRIIPTSRGDYVIQRYSSLYERWKDVIDPGLRGFYSTVESAKKAAEKYREAEYELYLKDLKREADRRKLESKSVYL